MKTFATLLVLAATAQAAAAESFGDRPEVKIFIGELVERHGFDAAKLERVFARTQRLDAPLQLIVPAERPSWQDYRAQFLNEARIARGAAFWKVNQKSLARAERKYGVSAAIIVAILGVETNYGRNMGRYRVLDALATLAFDYPPRASYFRNELEQYLLLTRESRADVFALQGSYAGAIGIPQFMPGSVRRYAVDFDGDGAIDLRRSSADAIGSVANFLHEHGWKAGEPVLLRAKLPPDAALFTDGGLRPRTRLGDIVAAGVALDPEPSSSEALGALFALEGDYRVGLQNFYVITRYNRSALYATAVADLADALAARVQSAGR
ncbi:MAG TPA: lytic murein transglycosylase B [Burkholderiales bacterium]|nr:lytic murein transglycosylase B [Burkholderiales bacterium]